MGRKLIVIGMVGLMSLGTGTPRLAAQFVDQGNSPAENVRNRGARAPGHLVRAGIAAHSDGPEITATAPPDLRARENLLVTIIQNLFNVLAGLIPLLPSVLVPDLEPPTGGGGGGGVNDVVMTEIAHDGNVVIVELLNRSPIEIRLDGWRFHDGINVSPALPVIELDRNTTLVVQLGGETQSALVDLTLPYRVQSIVAGELALYDFSDIDAAPFPQDDASLMIDYVQWNEDNEERDPPLESVAVRANLWNEIDFIHATLANTTFRLDAAAESRKTTSSRDFEIAAFDQNSLGVPESQNVAATDMAESDGTTP